MNVLSTMFAVMEQRVQIVKVLIFALVRKKRYRILTLTLSALA